MRRAQNNANGIDTGRNLRKALLLGCATIAITLPGMAIAQDAAPADQTAEEAPSEDIVVTGIRQTIQTSIDTKRRENAIVDALSSDDIGDLPALSVGQAIQTITGATTHREKGDASEIALRGLGPFLSNATFNGRDASNGSRRSRGQLQPVPVGTDQQHQDLQDAAGQSGRGRRRRHDRARRRCAHSITTAAASRASSRSITTPMATA